jgi:hypothetical protein
MLIIANRVAQAIGTINWILLKESSDSVQHRPPKLIYRLAQGFGLVSVGKDEAKTH